VYLTLDIHANNLTVSVPVENAARIGLRDVLDVHQMESLLAVLRAPTGLEESQWSRRIKDNREKLKTGTVLMVAAIVRDLSRRESNKGLSPAEREMLRDASRPLVIEISLALKISAEEAQAVLDSAVSTEDQANTAPTQLMSA
jgi:CarD family transcriptional regulator